jgi:hypothetical protein
MWGPLRDRAYYYASQNVTTPEFLACGKVTAITTAPVFVAASVGLIMLAGVVHGIVLATFYLLTAASVAWRVSRLQVSELMAASK